MKPEDYFAACRPIHAELAAIAERTYLMARTLCADPSNPAFVAAMDRQDVLHKALADLDAKVVV